MPFLFVGGTLLPENFTAESTRWLQQALPLFPFALLGAVVSHIVAYGSQNAILKRLQACYNAGAQFMEPLEGVVWLSNQLDSWLVLAGGLFLGDDVD